jgi:hypothetical protein
MLNGFALSDAAAKKLCCRTQRMRFRLAGLEKGFLEDFQLHDGLASGDGGEV